jgi:hypothetical protein
MGNGILEEWNIGIMGLVIVIVFHRSIGKVFFHIIPSFRHSNFPKDQAPEEIRCGSF